MINALFDQILFEEKKTLKALMNILFTRILTESGKSFMQE